MTGGEPGKSYSNHFGGGCRFSRSSSSRNCRGGTARSGFVVVVALVVVVVLVFAFVVVAVVVVVVAVVTVVVVVVVVVVAVVAVALVLVCVVIDVDVVGRKKTSKSRWVKEAEDVAKEEGEKDEEH